MQTIKKDVNPNNLLWLISLQLTSLECGIRALNHQFEIAHPNNNICFLETHQTFEDASNLALNFRDALMEIIKANENGENQCKN